MKITESDIEILAIEHLQGLGYPPDMEILATETVLKQAEMIAAELQN